MKRMVFLANVIAMSCAMLHAQSVTPTARGNGHFGFQVANLSFDIDSLHGARVDTLKANGNQMLFADESGQYWGSSFWISPQSAYSVSGHLDSSAFTGGVVGKSIVLAGQTDPSTHLQVIKRIQADVADTSITISYNVVNNGSAAVSFAGWEVTRVPPAGSLTFWPTGDTMSGPLSAKVQNSGNCSWYPNASNDPQNAKLVADGAEGWLAHVDANGVLFLKRFGDIARSQEAPQEGDVELYLAGSNYMELENQGAYQPIAVHDTLHYTVKWYVRKVPNGIAINAGSQALADYVRSIAPSQPTAERLAMQVRSIDHAKSPATYLCIKGPAQSGTIATSWQVYDALGRLLTQHLGTPAVYDLTPAASGVYLRKAGGTEQK